MSVKVKPNAKQNKILGVVDGYMTIALHAPPRDGAANKMLMKFLSEQIPLPKTKIEVIQGEASRIKRIRLPDSEQVRKFMAQFFS